MLLFTQNAPRRETNTTTNGCMRKMYTLSKGPSKFVAKARRGRILANCLLESVDNIFLFAGGSWTQPENRATGLAGALSANS